MIQTFDPNFKDFAKVEVERPDKDEIIKAVNALDEKLVNAASGEEAVASVKAFFKLSDDVRTAFALIYIRHTIDTNDQRYADLNDLVDEISPSITEAMNQFNNDFYESKYREDLEKAFGKLYFEMVKLSLKTFSPEIVPDLVRENQLVSEYVKLVSSGLIDFRGEKLSISQMGKYTSSLDRETRAEASAKVWAFYAENDEKIGEIYSEMIRVRTEIAKKLNYDNFLQLAYDRMGRLDWTPADAEEYRAKILKYIVPLSQEILTAQKDRLGYKEDTKFYDYAIFYKSGNPTPKGTPEELIAAARKMYAEMNPTVSHYFDFMVDHNCMDLLAKKGKAGGGYMEYIPGLKTSYIFSNFNGTSGDVDVLTHEFGHSLQGFLGAETTEVPDYRCPGMECAEMHSMSMEYLTYNWMDYFFKEDTDKYRYQHLCDAITFIPYGCIVDAFQAYIYTHPNMTHAERKAYWRSLERTYLPHKNYEGNAFLESGGFWMRQHHIFELPLYYLDYTIAQVVSLEFFAESRENFDKTLEKYLNFDKLGGKLPFRELLKASGIGNPMDGDVLKNVAEETMDYLKQFNPSSLDR